MEAKKRARLLLSCVVLVIAYLALFPNRAGREIVIHPAWSTSTALPGAARRDGQGFAFRAGGAFGYVDGSGALLRLERAFHDVALSDSYFANYSKAADAITLRRPDGSVAASLPRSGWPLLDNRIADAVFVFSTDLLGVAELSTDGTLRWERDFGSLMTCFAPFAEGTGPGRCVIGTLDGTLRVLGKDGAELYRVDSGSSRVACSYGCATSPDGRSVAAILGLDPQRIVVLEREDSSFVPAWSRELEHQVRAEQLVAFSADSRFVITDGGSALLVMDTRGRRSWSIPAGGTLSAAAAVGGEKSGGMVVELRRSDGSGELMVLALPDIVLARADLTVRDSASPHSIGAHGDFILLGAADRVTCLDVRRL